MLILFLSFSFIEIIISNFPSFEFTSFQIKLNMCLSQNVQDTPVARKKGRSSTPVPLSVRGRRTPTPVAGIRTGTPTPVAGIRTGTPTPVMGIRTGTRRNSVKIEADNESVASDTTGLFACVILPRYIFPFFFRVFHF